LFVGAVLTVFASSAQGDILTGLVSYWALDGNFQDAQGGNHGTEMGSLPIQFDTGKFGQGIDLNGEDQYILIPNEDQFDFVGQSMSISAWFRVDSFDTSWQALVAKGEGDRWRLHRRGGEQSMTFAGGVGEGPAGRDVNDGQIHHVVAVSEAGVSTRLYIDGVLDSTGGVPSIGNNDLQVRIGDNPDTNNREWEGLIDDVAIWGRVLTDDEIAAIWNGGAGASIASLAVSGTYSWDFLSPAEGNWGTANWNAPAEPAPQWPIYAPPEHKIAATIDKLNANVLVEANHSAASLEILQGEGGFGPKKMVVPGKLRGGR
jgi:hypothetical protein